MVKPYPPHLTKPYPYPYPYPHIPQHHPYLPLLKLAPSLGFNNTLNNP